jgi:hypothetical protein
VNKTAELRAAGFIVVEMWECAWKVLTKDGKAGARFVTHYPLEEPRAMHFASIVAGLKDGSLFGMVEVDIEVKKTDREYFSEMQPIFKNTNVSKEDVGDTMLAFVEGKKAMNTPRRALIGSYEGKKMMMISPLAQWYLNTKKMTITNVHQVIQYLPAPCFAQFGKDVSDARRAGDADPNKAIIADTMKLLGNSAYGK